MQCFNFGAARACRRGTVWENATFFPLSLPSKHHHHQINEVGPIHRHWWEFCLDQDAGNHCLKLQHQPCCSSWGKAGRLLKVPAVASTPVNKAGSWLQGEMGWTSSKISAVRAAAPRDAQPAPNRGSQGWMGSGGSGHRLVCRLCPSQGTFWELKHPLGTGNAAGEGMARENSVKIPRK